jgi:hypothetical protein
MDRSTVVPLSIFTASPYNGREDKAQPDVH